MHFQSYMIFSRFNICSSFGENNIVIYNTLNKALLKIDKNLYDINYFEKLSKMYPKVKDFIVYD